jgi:hypothetical protein
LNGTITRYGKRFDCALVAFLHRYRLSDSFTYEQPATFTDESVVFVTYSSQDHFLESKAMIVSLRRLFPNKIFYYPLNLNNASVSSMTKRRLLTYYAYIDRRTENGLQFGSAKHRLVTISIICHQFQALPLQGRFASSMILSSRVIARLFSVKDAFWQIQAFWFIDSSIRFKTNKLGVIYDGVAKNRLEPFLSRRCTYHSTFAVTHSSNINLYYEKLTSF